MKSVAALFIALASLASAAVAQKPDDLLATANGHKIYFRDLSPDTQKLVADMPARTAKFRSDILTQMMNERALAAEAKAAGSTPAKLINAEKAKIAAPSEAEIQAVIDGNQAALAQFPAAEARKKVITYLRSEPEQKAIATYLATLTKKYSAAPGKDINAPN